MRMILILLKMRYYTLGIKTQVKANGSRLYCVHEYSLAIYQ